METCIGRVTHYYNHLGVAVLSLSGDLESNDFLHFLGHMTDFFQKAWSLEIAHQPVRAVGPGADVALKVAEPVRKGDKVFLVLETVPGETEDILSRQLRDWEERIY